MAGDAEMPPDRVIPGSPWTLEELVGKTPVTCQRSLLLISSPSHPAATA